MIKNKIITAVLAAFLISSPCISVEPKYDPNEIEALIEWYYTLAVQAATWGAPLVTMHALRNQDATGPHPKAVPNTIWKMENISTPALSQEAGYVTPNVNVIYGFGFMDLRQEPIVIQVPDSDDRYYMVEIVDMWTNAFAYIGGKSTGYKGGAFILTAPGWKGDIPVGLKEIPSPTPWVLLQPRVGIYLDGELDLKGAKGVLNQIKTVGLSAYLGQPAKGLPTYTYIASNPVDPKLAVSVLEYKDPLQFWEILTEAMNENPPPEDQIRALLPMFKPLGIQLGQPWDRSKLPSAIVDVMREAAKNIGPMLAHLPFGKSYQGALIPPPTIGDFGNDYQTRAVVARVGLTANIPYEAIYWMYIHDSEGKVLTGKKKYTMSFKGDIPYYDPGFWSITMYDSKSNYTIANPINRYMLGSDSETLKKNSDGSFTLYIQKESPGKELEGNWLPAPAGDFYLVPRVYAPKPEAIAILKDVNSWPVPPVVPLN